MRVLMICWEYPPYVAGGMGRHVAGLVPALSQVVLNGEPLIIDVITPRYAGGEVIESIHPCIMIYRVEMPLIKYKLYESVLANNELLIDCANTLFNKYKYDLIHIHDWLTGKAGLTLKDAQGIPVLATIHAIVRDQLQKSQSSESISQIDQLERKVCHEAEQVIVCSHFMRQKIHEYWGLSLNKINVIPNGIRIKQKEKCSVEELEALRQQYAPLGQKLLFFIGKVTYEKGLLVLIRAMPRILSEHPSLRLLIAGEHGKQLWPLAYELNIEKAIDFLGYVSEYKRNCLYQIADAAVFPSLYEPFGIVALEAMALGCNVIASDVGGLGEVVKHKENGLTVPPNDPQSIAQAVNQLFADPVAAQERRARALHEVDTLYRWEKIAEQTARVYQSVSEASRREWNEDDAN